MDQFVKDLVRKYEGKTPYEKLALNERQKAAVAELKAALKKCKLEQVAFVKSGNDTYVINDEDVMDFDCQYDDYSCEEIDSTKLQKLDMRLRFYEIMDGKVTCTVSFLY